ncbi:MAG: hypothetical protein ACXVB0_20630 [Mucilaginibacter sp.]
MKQFLPNTFAILFFTILSGPLFGQEAVLPTANNAEKIIRQIQDNGSITTDSTFKLLSNWLYYPTIDKTGKDYLCYYTDSLYGKIPFRVFVPISYDHTRKSPCILLLHGAVGGSKFSDIDSLNKFDDDVLFAALKRGNYIIVRPVADRSKNFNWVVDNFKSPNPTFKTLTNMLVSIKRILNIDDNKIFALGHSDGADGAIGLGVYSPNPFAGFAAYNSMLTNLFAKDFYIRNITNNPLYLVHSDLDDLRPIQQTRVIVSALSQLNNQMLYKEYIGYQHYDKHLSKDIPNVGFFINSTSRNPFKSNIFWETEKVGPYNSCGWIKITGIDTFHVAANWHTPFDFKSYFKNTGKWIDNLWYNSRKSAAVRATYNNNTFNIETSRVTEIELLISPVMVNLENPVIVNINGKQVFSGKISADKDFLIRQFKDNFDRQALWVNAIKIKTIQ